MGLELHEQFRRSRLIGVLEAICEHLELSATQSAEAKTRYEGAGSWLADASHPALAGALIYVQGSTAIGTTVKPIGRDEHDVDLIARLSNAARGYSPSLIKKLIGDRLKEHGTYERLLEEMCRCWRLDYANEFHLDITPSIPNPNCPNGGELVPDKELQSWKASNPKGFKELFDRRALLSPRFRMEKRVFSADEKAGSSVEPYPTTNGFKGLLRRTVQVSKRHRDIYFQRRAQECAPISVIITTLLARSYERCALQNVYEDELEMLMDVIFGMIDFIENTGGKWYIWNETTAGENFAEKWNTHPDRAESFFTWHRIFVDEVRELLAAEGMDRIGRRLEDSLGSGPASIGVRHLEDAITSSRRNQSLRYGAAGLTAASAATPAAGAAQVARNTFFGR